MTIISFEEPELEFRYGQRTQDPRDGLSLFGPYDADLPSQPKGLPHVVLGTDEGIEKFNRWTDAMQHSSFGAPKGNLRLWTPYPGFEAAFCTNWSPRPIWQQALDRDLLLGASRLYDPHERAFKVVEPYLAGLSTAATLDEQSGVAICIVPDEVWQNCRPESYVSEPIGTPISSRTLRSRRSGQLDMYESYNPDQYFLSTDFRRQLKARAMTHGIPLQIIRESTLRLTNEKIRGQRGLTPLSDRMWNIGTALYYKCGGKPWRLLTARDGVCYIGIAFRRTGEGNTACCAAQMFLNSGDGIVFMGKFGPWYSPRTKQFHLEPSVAKELLEGVLRTYAELGGKDLAEIFLHSRSGIYEEEFEGYQQACPPSVTLTGVRVRLGDRNKGIRLYRLGTRPVLRGTFWRLSERSGLLWASGFKPRLATYDGWEVPAPLQIDVQHGEASIERVAQDIFGLTKLNYNACRLGESEPVTVGFSNEVGEILISNPTVKTRKPNFKFYI